MKWRPISEAPIPSDFSHSAVMIAIEGSDWTEAALLNGISSWDALNHCWVDELNGEPIEDGRDIEYWWCFEDEIINLARQQIKEGS
jgi:hypothetical protein